MPPTQAISTSQGRLIVALVGNPNTGKSTLFNALTGHHQRVGNYPGVTVEKRCGDLELDAAGPPTQLIDLPGAYSLSARARDEAILLEVMLGRHADIGQPDLFVVVVDASHLSRNLFFATQVLEIGKPVVIALNMTDVAERDGMHIDVATLSRELAVPVVPVIATKRTGIDALKRAIASAFGAPANARCTTFPACVCAELDGLAQTLRNNGQDHHPGAVRMEALQTLLDPGGYHEERLVRRCGRSLARELVDRRRRIQDAGESLAEVEARVRYAWIERVTEQVVTRTAARRSRTAAVDKVLTHSVCGMVVLLVLLATCFQAIYSWAGPLMDAIDGGFGYAGRQVTRFMPPGALRSLMVDGALAGVGAVLTFLPQILILFLFVAVLEDCGYMARAAFLLDRWMRYLGLGGKSFIPLLSSFACAVPGILSTRTIENRRDRLVTVLIAPLMSCSARLPVYTLLIGTFVPATALFGGWLGLQALTLLALYMLGAVIAVPIALLLKATVLKGPSQPFLMELPTYKWPSLRTVAYRVYEQGREFCISAGTIIFAVALVIWALGYYPHPPAIAASFDLQRTAVSRGFDVEWAQLKAARADPALDGTSPPAAEAAARRDQRLAQLDHEEAGEYLRQSFLGRMGQWIEPAVRPLGWDWRIGTAAIAAFPAREVFVATMGTIYNLGAEVDEEIGGLRAKLREATWPDGRPVYTLAVALSIMVFFALCCQCGGTLAAIRRETGSWGWPAFTFAYMTVLAYAGAFLVYQIAARFV